MMGRIHVPSGPGTGRDRLPGLRETSAASETTSRVVAAIVVTGAYFGAARLGFSLAPAHAAIAAIWAPTGVALAAVLLGGYRMIPAIALGALLAGLTRSVPVSVAAAIMVGNTLEVLIAVWLLRRVRFDRSLTRMRDVVALVGLAAMLSTLVGATIGIGSLAVSGSIPAGEIATAWRTWWLASMGGDLLVATALIVLWGTPRSWLRTREALLTLALSLLLMAATLVIFSYDRGFPYLACPFLFLLALLCRQRGAVVGGLIMAGIAVWFTAHGHGSFVVGTPDANLIRAQVFVGISAITALLVAAARSERDVAEQALATLAHKERILEDAQRLARVGSFEWDVREQRTTWSEELYRIVGLDPTADPPGYGAVRKLLHDEDRAIVDAIVERSCREWTPYESVHRIIRPDGQVRTLECHTRVERDAAGEPLRMVGTALDITALALAEERFRALFETAPYARVVVDPGGTVVLVNSHTEQLFDFTRHELIGKHLDELIPTTGAAAPWYGITLDDPTDGEGPIELRARRRGGDEFPIEVSLTPLVTEQGPLVSVAVTDISERKLAAEALAHRASHDALTGLPNRTLFLDRLEHAIRRAGRSRRRLAVMFLDLDDFKLVNDTRGHDVGDLLLVGLTPRLNGALRPGDTIARFGGDEFVVLCEDLSDERDALAIADRISRACSEPIVIGDHEHVVTVSIGVVLVADPELVSPSDVLRDADAAMYRAKAIGKGRIELFDEDMRTRLVERTAIETSLRRAMRQDELRVFYQPVIALEHGTVRAAEALLRWQHPHRGVIEPAEFLRVAENSGLILPIDEWVIEQACRQVTRWRENAELDAPIHVSVNLSARQLAREDIGATVARILRRTGLEPGALELEVTEGALFEDLELSTRALRELKTIGVRLALDDFGTGYSSLAYLRRLPIDAVKIDRSLVEGLGRYGEDTAIVNAVLDMARALHLSVTAEGVETRAQLERLRALGCESAQGYLLGRPGPPEQMTTLLRAASLRERALV
jgi:diguanylate cyclase (GGDEF)-like protein/PAS domain S-box-containing protein